MPELHRDQGQEGSEKKAVKEDLEGRTGRKEFEKGRRLWRKDLHDRNSDVIRSSCAVHVY